MKRGASLSAFLGFAIASGSPLGLAISILGPVIWLRQKSRPHAYICALTYYLAALHDLIVVSRNFFGPESGLFNGVCLWTVSAGLLSSPWFFAWSSRSAAALWRVPLALLASVVPPLGLIGWASPVASAGLLFPGTQFAGVLLVLFLPALLLTSDAFGLLVLTGTIAVAHFVSAPEPQPPRGWQAINTHFGSVGHGHPDLVRDYNVGTEIARCVAHSNARVLIFPEAVAPVWIGGLLQTKNKIVLTGAIVPKGDPFALRATLDVLQSRQTPDSTDAPIMYSNKVLMRGEQTTDFNQRVPIPIGMWQPFEPAGVPLDLTGPGTTIVAGRRVAIIICYEQLIGWPVLTSFAERPSLIVAVSNNFWVSDTSIPKVERTMILAWASLFGVPALSASNT